MSETRKTVCHILGMAILNAIRKFEDENDISASELAISVAAVMNLQMDEFSIVGNVRELYIEMFNDLLNMLPHEKKN